MKLYDRMMAYENNARSYLMCKTPVVIRVDGKNFRTFTRGLYKPFDRCMLETMQKTMKDMAAKIEGCVMAYTFSDEISFLLLDTSNDETCAWYGNCVQKMASISASMATLLFNNNWVDSVNNANFDEDNPNHKGDKRFYKNKAYTALFDARAFNIPFSEIGNYFIHRQNDCIRNSVSNVARLYFSDTELKNVGTRVRKEMLKETRRINWDNFPAYLKYGTLCYKKPVSIICENRESAPRTKFILDYNTPHFIENKTFIEEHILV